MIQPWSCREAVKLPGLWQVVTWGNKEPVKARQVPARVAVAWLRSCKEWIEAGNREWRKLLLLVSDNIFYNSKLLFYFYAVAYQYKTTKHRVTTYIILYIYIYYIPYPHLEICLKEGNWDVGTPMQPFHKLSIIEPVPQIDTIWSQHPYWIVVSDSTIQVVPRTQIHSPFTVPLKFNMSWWFRFFRKNARLWMLPQGRHDQPVGFAKSNVNATLRAQLLSRSRISNDAMYFLQCGKPNNKPSPYMSCINFSSKWWLYGSLWHLALYHTSPLSPH